MAGFFCGFVIMQLGIGLTKAAHRHVTKILTNSVTIFYSGIVN